MTGVRNPELGVAYAERATSNLNSLKIGPSGIRDHHIVRSDHRKIGVETLNVDAPVRADGAERWSMLRDAALPRGFSA